MAPTTSTNIRPVRGPATPRLTVAIVASVAVAMAPGCSTDGEQRVDASTTTDAPAASAPASSDPTTTTLGGTGTTGGTATASTSSPSTSAAAPGQRSSGRASSTTALLPASSGLPPVLSKNSKGVDIALDETALLACAQDQIAWVALQGGSTDDVAAALAVAAQRAAASAVPAVSSSAPTLQAAASSASPKAEVDRFLDLCVANGFES